MKEGWYWIRRYRKDGPWVPRQWYVSRHDGEEGWTGLAYGDEPAVVGPHIPYPEETE